jgi:hypothetical protein
VNPDHPDAARISVGPEQPLVLDPRLFRSQPPQGSIAPAQASVGVAAA